MAPTPASVPAVAETSWRASATSLGTRAAPWLGGLWCAGLVIGLLRLAGGWALAQWIRRRATRVEAPHLVDAVTDVGARWGLPAVPLLTSAHVDAPVVVGVRAPAILLPVDLERRLEADALPPLLAHELAHVRRGDYASNLAQSIADALLWFSPGARFVSRYVREAREYCCDDVVASRCGAGAYAAALTTLAGLGVAAQARPAVNAAGPRLIVRIRRLLQEDAMVPFAGSRLVGFGVAFALVVAAGAALVPASAAGVAQTSQAFFDVPVEGPIARGFVALQPSAAVALRDMTWSPSAYCETATVENRANVTATAIRFAAYASTPEREGSALATGSVQTSDLLPVDLAPGATTVVAVGLMSREQVQARVRAGTPQVMCAITEIHYANGAQWNGAPATIFGPDHAEVPRARLDGPPTPGAAFCTDERERAYSEGAVVGIALEPGAFARCHDGAWSEYVLPARASGALFVRMDLRLSSGRTPALGVAAGGMAQIGLAGGQTWGFRPLVDAADASRVQLEVYDLAKTPHAKVAELSLRVGDPLVDVPGTSLQIRIRSTRNP
jgi:beta-lactamase regulating signal transducer with metallopeptidase domain